MRMRDIGLAVAAGMAAMAAPGEAAVYDFDLTGQIGSGSLSTFSAGGLNYSIFQLDLDGFASPFDLEVGDVLNLTVTLDGLVNVGASTISTFFGIDALTAPARFALLDGGDVISSSMLTPSEGTYAGQTFFGACSNCIAATASLGPAPAFTVGQLTGSITIESLAPFDPQDTSPVSLNGFQFRYQLASSTVPEPAGWAMMLLGFGILGAVVRARPRHHGGRAVAAR